MTAILEFIKNMDLLGFNEMSILLRFVLATICGGLIGIEREHKHRPAGFRTHILVCLGAATTTLTGQYLLSTFGTGSTDPARLGAQVIAGIGFIGAGTIIVTKRRQVKGLTTAAGLWASAIVGLCCGAGFIEGALLATVIIMVAELLLVKIEHLVLAKARTCNIYVEYTDNSKLGNIVDTIKENSVHIVDMEITKLSSDTGHFCAVFTIQMNRKKPRQLIMTMLAKLEGVVAVEEL